MSGDIPQAVQDAVNSMSFTDIDENPLKAIGMRILEAERLQIYCMPEALKQLCTAAMVIAVTCLPASADENESKNDNNNNNEYCEKIVSVAADSNECSLVEWEDKITMEDLSPAELIEYAFNDSGQFFLAPMSKPSLEGYRGMKFKNWKHMIEHPVCEAAFKRLLNIGLITNMFDHLAFPSPADEIENWQVKDDHGKIVMIPRPVHALRCWNAKARCYEAITAHLDGAPDESEAKAYWEAMLDKFRNERGTEYINTLLKSFQESENSNSNSN